ncbi:hypothetical protein AAW14_04015 [Streptomyces hygroscopicus]|uniref:hypothetical protein n=1 Tax=Streptomyces hygroscopicus TaxID=1912 RepID=UPI00223EEE79|nr:hypothetical protein [Streptomyces hygroscopicus]MCW7941249.1 hypothetical protein [Streptomyces hygroscopicus]
MIAVALLLPASMLCLLLALGRYEERMLTPHGDAQDQGALPGRRLRAVPEPSPSADGPGPHLPAEPTAPKGTRTTPGSSRTRQRAA